MVSATETGSADQPLFQLLSSRGFPGWLADQQVSLAFTTYQTGKLFLLGLKPDQRLSVFERNFNRCLGLWSDGQTLWMSSLFQLWRFENALEAGQEADGYDRLYVPQVGYVTGDLDIHDIAVEVDGRVVFVNTLFGCLATISHQYSFVPLWKPPFLSRLAAEDRCHLNGLALEAGRSAFVTGIGQCDVADGWRSQRRDGGFVMDVRTNQTIVTGLSMPHSPRVYRDQLWVLESGTGHLGKIDRVAGTFEPLVFCPGYLRGLTFINDYAIVGLSECRRNRTFQDLALDENLRRRNAQPRCGLCVVDLRTLEIAHWIWLEGIVSELYDFVVLPGTKRPAALGFKTNEILRTFSIGQAGNL